MDERARVLELLDSSAYQVRILKPSQISVRLQVYPVRGVLYEGHSYRHCRNLQISAGGSLANTMANLAKLGQAEAQNRLPEESLRVAAASVVGTDALGAFHSAQQRNSGVRTLAYPQPDSGTGAPSSDLLTQWPC